MAKEGMEKKAVKKKETAVENRLNTLTRVSGLLQDALGELDTALCLMNTYDENHNDIPENAQLFDFLEKSVEDYLTDMQNQIKKKMDQATFERELEKGEWTQK